MAVHELRGDICKGASYISHPVFLILGNGWVATRFLMRSILTRSGAREQIHCVFAVLRNMAAEATAPLGISILRDFFHVDAVDALDVAFG